MNPIFKDKTKGRILYSDTEVLYKSVNNTLLLSTDEGKSWKKVFKLKDRSLQDFFVYKNHMACRLFRKGIHHFNVDPENQPAILFDKRTALLKDGSLYHEKSIKGSRPLSFENIAGEFVFGEYRSNPERSEIGIYGISDAKKLYKKLEMTGIRHIHGIYKDPYTGFIWITTGDNDDEAAIYRTDTGFSKLEKVLHGSQQTRTIKLLFHEDYIYFGSDAPDEVNYLYRLNKNSLQAEKLIEVGSSVFHGCQAGNWLFFSTAVEPSEVNRTKYAELWASPDGSVWKCILRLKKDMFPMRYFQYGQIFFPAGNFTDKDHIWFSPFATEKSNHSYRLYLKDVEELFFEIK